MQRTHRVILTIPDEAFTRFETVVALARTMRPGLSRASAIKEGMVLWEMTAVPTMQFAQARAYEVALMREAMERGEFDKLMAEQPPGLAQVMAQVNAKLTAGRDED